MYNEQYTVLHLQIDKPIYADILVAELTQLGYDGFEEIEPIFFKAYVPSRLYEEEKLLSLIQKYQQQTSIELIEKEIINPKNWNAVWESNFTPFKLDNKVLVKAPFHEIDQAYKYIIHIEPKMAFGTGHHATTAMMMEQMLELDFTNKKVLDFGCGTGILAILAAMLGATSIVAIDNDPLAEENTLENIAKNEIGKAKITTLLGTHQQFEGQTFDLILANINKNVIVQCLPILQKALNNNPNTHLLISGILITDKVAISQQINNLGLAVKGSKEQAEWAMLWVGKS